MLNRYAAKPGLVVAAVLMLTPWFGAEGASKPELQPKTHLGGKVGAIVELVQDCSGLPPTTCGNAVCLACLHPCDAGTPGYPLCCQAPTGLFCTPDLNSACSSDTQCATLQCNSAGAPETLPGACVPSCSAGENTGKTCGSAADCPHVLVHAGDTCLGIQAGAAKAQDYTVPSGSDLIVTDVLAAGSIELSSDDKAADVTVSGTEHFTAGLVFPAGSHVNIKGITNGGLAVQLLGYLVKAS